MKNRTSASGSRTRSVGRRIRDYGIGYTRHQGRRERQSDGRKPDRPALLEAVVRLMRTLDTPEEIPILAPLITKEIVYRLMRGEQGAAASATF